MRKQTDLRSHNSLFPHFQPGIKQTEQTVRVSSTVGQIHKNEIHTRCLQHQRMFALYPGIRIAVIAKIRLSPVKSACGGRVLQISGQLSGTDLQILGGNILRNLRIVAGMCNKVEQPNLLL